MLFDRQRVLLELLDALNEPVGSTDFQKLLFLYTREGEPTPSYEFVPYRFGCFSFTSYADKRRLVEQELIENERNMEADRQRPSHCARRGKVAAADGSLCQAIQKPTWQRARRRCLPALPVFCIPQRNRGKSFAKERRSRPRRIRPTGQADARTGHARLRKQNLGSLPEPTATGRRDLALRCPAESAEPEIWFFQKHVEPRLRRRWHPIRAFAGTGHPVGQAPGSRNADRLRQAVCQLRTHDAAEANQDARQNCGLD